MNNSKTSMTNSQINLSLDTTPVLQKFDFNLPEIVLVNVTKEHIKLKKTIGSKLEKSRATKVTAYQTEDKVIVARGRAMKKELEKSAEKEVRDKMKEKKIQNKLLLKKQDVGSVSACLLDLEISEYELQVRDDLLQTSNSQILSIKQERQYLLESALTNLKGVDVSCFKEYRAEAHEMIKQRQRMAVVKKKDEQERELLVITKRVKKIKHVSDLPNIMKDKENLLKQHEIELQTLRARQEEESLPTIQAWDKFNAEIEAFYTNCIKSLSS